jgi:hypothetical protein
MRPVFFLRPRDYSKSVPVAPFIINYSGALFREYPGPWQVGAAAAPPHAELCHRQHKSDGSTTGCSRTFTVSFRQSEHHCLGSPTNSMSSMLGL